MSLNLKGRSIDMKAPDISVIYSYQDKEQTPQSQGQILNKTASET